MMVICDHATPDCGTCCHRFMHVAEYFVPEGYHCTTPDECAHIEEIVHCVGIDKRKGRNAV